MRKILSLTFTSLALLAACKPPAADGYVERVDLTQAGSFASEPLPSPDTTGAVWAASEKPGRILFGLPGKPPLVALACSGTSIELTRFAPADPEAQAFAALVGNSHVVRIPVDAVPSGRASIWRGSVTAENPGLEALTGTEPVELTIPGAGTVVLTASPLPGALVTQCRPQIPTAEPAPPASLP
jgi:hypothetical protein